MTRVATRVATIASHIHPPDPMSANRPVPNLLALVALVVCAGCRTAHGAVNAGGEGRCRLREVERRVLIANDGRALYVEPQTFTSNGREALLAGAPSLVWRPDPDSGWVMEKSNSVFGVIVAPGKPARIVPRPAGSSDAIDGVQGVANRDGSWTVIWLEVDSASREETFPRVLRLRAARLLGDGRWAGPPEELPVPEDVERLNYRTASVPFAVGDSVLWGLSASIRERPQRGLLYVRHAGKWRVERLPGPHVLYVAPAWSARSGLVAAVIRPDTTLLDDGNSLFLYGHRNGWRVLQRIVLGKEAPAYTPQWAVTSHGLALGWKQYTGGILGHPAISAALLGDSVSATRPSISQVYLVPTFKSGPLGAPIWLTQDVRDSGMVARVTMVRDGHVDTLGTVRSRSARFTFTRFAAFHDAADRNLILTGPEASPSGDSLPPFFSRLVEARIECPGATH